MHRIASTRNWPQPGRWLAGGSPRLRGGAIPFRTLSTDGAPKAQRAAEEEHDDGLDVTETDGNLEPQSANGNTIDRKFLDFWERAIRDHARSQGADENDIGGGRRAFRRIPVPLSAPSLEHQIRAGQRFFRRVLVAPSAPAVEKPSAVTKPLAAEPSPSNVPIVEDSSRTKPLAAEPSPSNRTNQAATAVVGSFLFQYRHTYSSETARVGLFRRSPRASVYPDRLGLISGKVEESDATLLAAAVREIQEETSLTYPQDLELLLRGKPYQYRHGEKLWDVTAFAFRLKSKKEGGMGRKGIRLYEENVRCEWHPPLEVRSADRFRAVPNLTRSLSSVWPHRYLGNAMGSKLVMRLKVLRQDPHEAHDVIRAALDLLRQVVLSFHDEEGSEAALNARQQWMALRMVSWHIADNVRVKVKPAVKAAMLDYLHGIQSVADKLVYTARDQALWERPYPLVIKRVREGYREQWLEELEMKFWGEDAGSAPQDFEPLLPEQPEQSLERTHFRWEPKAPHPGSRQL